ncbi:MAG: acyltransferase family protein [Erysipelotrichaceae bacterium]|nr:acyltransferase family protein [Erysipelotrichaceae bacterium]
MKKERFEEIDLIKALGIILIVAGHAGFPYSPFINFFHVSVFFIASGYVYKPGYASDVKSLFIYLWKKIRFLCFPYFLYNAVLSLLHNLLIGIGFYSLRSAFSSDVSGLALTGYWSGKEILINIVKGLLFRGDNELIQGIWFIKDLFIISLLYCIVDFLIRILKAENRHLQTFISLILLCAGFYLNARGILPYGMSRILSYYSLFHLGVILREKKDLLQCDDIRIRTAAIPLPLILFFILQRRGLSVSLVKNRYQDPLFLLISALAGWMLCYETARRITETDRLKKILLYLGRNSYTVLLLHIICFKPAILLRLAVTGDPAYFLSCVPDYKGEENVWWLIYSLSGILLPMLYCIGKDLVFKTKKKGI